MAQARLDKKDLAEATVLKGVEIHNDAAMRRSAAEFYVLQYEIATREHKDDLATRFQYLEKALRQDLFYAVIYERLIAFYQASQDIETESDPGKRAAHAKTIETMLTKLIVEGQSPALAHFALSSIYQIQGQEDKASITSFNPIGWMEVFRWSPITMRGCSRTRINLI